MGIPQSKLDEWRAWFGILCSRTRLGGWVGRALDGEVEDPEVARAQILAGVDLGRIAFPALLDEVERLTRERDHNRDVITRAVSRLPVPYSLSELVAEWEAMRALLREEVLPFVEHAVQDYDCAKGIVLAERLAAFLK